MNTLMDEIDGQGQVVKSNITLGMYDQLPAGHQWVPHVQTLGEAQTDMNAQIEIWRDAACQVNVQSTVSGTVYNWQADQRSKDLLDSVLSLMSHGIAPPTIWRSADNINVAVAPADLIGIAGAMAGSTQAAYAHSWALKASIFSDGVTVAQVNAITW